MAEPTEAEMSLIGHLTELRTRLITSILAVALTTFVAFFFARPLLKLLTEPIAGLSTEPGKTDELHATIGEDGVLRIDNMAALSNPKKISLKRMIVSLPADPKAGRPADTELVIGEPRTQTLRYESPIDPFMMQFKVAMILGILLALPIVLYQIWLFVMPGLTNNETRIVKPLLGGAVIMFPIGAGFAYFVIQLLLRVMQTYQVDTISAYYDASKYLSLLTTLMLTFGVIFEMPLIIAVAANIGLVTPKMLTQYRRHAYVGMGVVAMFLTPPDAISMIAGYVPMILLYELSVLLCRPMALMHAKEKKAKAEAERREEGAVAPEGDSSPD